MLEVEVAMALSSWQPDAASLWPGRRSTAPPLVVPPVLSCASHYRLHQMGHAKMVRQASASLCLQSPLQSRTYPCSCTSIASVPRLELVFISHVRHLSVTSPVITGRIVQRM